MDKCAFNNLKQVFKRQEIELIIDYRYIEIQGVISGTICDGKLKRLQKRRR